MAARLVLILLFVGISAVSPLLDLTGRSSVPLDVAFRCNDGRHVEIVRRCDASVDCVDGSDESSAACNAPNRTVSVGDKLAARVQYKREHGAIWIMICDGRECSTLSVSGATPTGALAYMAYTSCNMMGDQCGILHREEKSYDARDFASGGLVLELERRPTELAVWLQGFPEHTATVPTRRDDSFLRVRPLYWKHDMVVKFSGLALLASGVPFWCTNRLSLDAKCPCAEGCDEMACEAPNAVLQVGDRRTVRVQYKDEHWAVWFLLCDDCSCSKISVTGFSADGELAFWPATGCTNLGHHCRDLRREVRPRGPENFLSSGEIVFEAEKRDWELVVWLKGHSEYRATVPAKERSVIFKVRPLHWASEMPVKFADDVDVWGVPPFVCDDGRRVEGMSKCDGVTNCADGSDEAVSLCDVAATTLAVGNRRSVRVQYRQEHWAVWFVLCGEVDCSTVSVSGIDPDGSLHYWAYSNCTRMGDHCKNLLHSSKPGGGTPFPSGELKFEVERLRQEVSIWLKDRPDHKASIPLSHATICLLKVRPLMWKSNMIVRISDQFAPFHTGTNVIRK